VTRRGESGHGDKGELWNWDIGSEDVWVRRYVKIKVVIGNMEK